MEETAFPYITGINVKNEVSSDQFARDAAARTLPGVSWVYAPSEFDEHLLTRSRVGMETWPSAQWTVAQVNALVMGGYGRAV